jgi:hypothetical protein
MATLSSLGGHLTTLTWAALRTFLSTLILLTAAGVALAAVSAYFLRDRPGYAMIAAVIAIAEAVATGVVLGGHRAIILTLAHALGSLRLGRQLVRLVFDRLLGLAEGGDVGERGGRIARGLERVPLAQAERMLREAVASIAGSADDTAGWLRRRVQARLLALAEKYTLARFREDGQRNGGVDLLKVKADLEEGIDDALVRKVRTGTRLWTALVILGLPGVVAAQTYITLALLK